MLSFIISLIVPIILAIATIFFSYKTYKTVGDKISKFNFLTAMCSLMLTIYFGINIKPPAPIIYPLDNETRIYSDNAKITIESDGFDIYYSLDGSDPQNGEKYEEPIIITSSTTVVAKNKFLFWWSEPSQRAYRFESIPITYSGELDLLLSDKLPSGRELLDYTIYIIIFAFIVRALIKRGWQNICNRIRNFFNP